MPVVPPYHLSKIWCLWSPLTIWAKFHACGPPLPFEQNLIPVVPLTIWCHKNARLQPYDLMSQKRKIWCLRSPHTIWVKFDVCGPPYYLSKIWCLWSPLTIWAKFDDCGPPLTMWPKFDACGPPLPFKQNLMPVVPPYHLVSQERKAVALWFGVTKTQGYI